MDNYIGRKLDGRYKIVEIIGVGGMANVYKGIDLKENRTIAVKVLREEFASNPELVRRFKNESKAISVLNHPNIVKVYDVNVTDQTQYIVMEYIDGITLKEYMEQRGEALTYKETLHFITQLLRALQHAHEKGIVHRDIKPQNVMLLLDSSIKIMDFGIARFSRSESQTITDKAIGSVHYISPEQARGDATDLKADIYSVGVMMYEMLAGKLPFDSDNAVSIALKQISDEATPLCEVNPNVPEALQTITARAMAKDPKDRYQSAREMLYDIEEFKKNPSVRFEYRYMSNDTGNGRYTDKVAGRNSSAGARSRRGDEQRKKKHYTLPVLAGMAAAFLVGAVILVLLILKMSGNELFTKVESVALPNFIGKMQNDIRNDDKYAGFKIQWEEVYDSHPAGQVFYQNPKPPKKVKANATITLRVSKGEQIVTIPDVVGYDKDEAKQILMDAGVYVMLKPKATEGTADGIVLGTDPVADTQVSAGETVVIYYSQHRETKMINVPRIIDMTLAEARSELSKYHLRIGSIEYIPSDLPADTVLGQLPEPGTSVPWNSSISITVSSGVPITVGESGDKDDTSSEESSSSSEEPSAPSESAPSGSEPSSSSSPEWPEPEAHAAAFAHPFSQIRKRFVYVF